MRLDIESHRTILKLQVEEAIKIVVEKNHGLHIMLIYPSLEILRKFYSKYIELEIEERNGTVVISSFYETTESVRSTLSSTLTSRKMADYENDNTIHILDAARYYKANPQTIDFTNTIAKSAKTMGKSNFTSMGDMSALFFNYDFKNLMFYEISLLPKTFSNDRNCFCFYNQKDMEKLTEDQEVLLFEQHGIVIELLD